MVNNMTKQKSLAAIFKRLRDGEMPEQEIISLSQEIAVSDVEWMMASVAQLTGPHDFMDDLNEYDDNDNAKSAVIAKGFFLYIDLISALIMKLGDEAVTQAKCLETSNNHYVPWIIKYCTDQRFAKGIKENFSFLEI